MEGMMLRNIEIWNGKRKQGRKKEEGKCKMKYKTY